MKKNKLVAFSLCAALLATALTGCGGAKAQDTNTEADSKEPVSISFMTPPDRFIHWALLLPPCGTMN